MKGLLSEKGQKLAYWTLLTVNICAYIPFVGRFPISIIRNLWFTTILKTGEEYYRARTDATTAEKAKLPGV